MSFPFVFFLVFDSDWLFIVLYIGTLNKQLAVCKVDARGDVIAGQHGCYHLIPVFDWIRRCIVSIFLVFFIAFFPLFLQGGFLVSSPLMEYN